MTRTLPLIAAALLLAACDPMQPPGGTAPPTDLPFFGDGYRFGGDVCRRVGEDAFTGAFLDDAADLVGCPEDAETLGALVADTGAIEVARRDGYILYSVPVR